MKYDKILCWLDNDTPISAFENYSEMPLHLTYDYKEFLDNITENSYTAIDLTLASKNLKKLFKLFPNQKFNIILNSRRLYNEVIDAFSDEDKVYKHYTIIQLMENFGKKA